MAGAGEGEFAFGAVAGERAAGAGGGAVADSERGNQHIAGANAHFVADNGLVFVHAVVVASDGAGADVAAAADLRVAEVGEVVGFAAAADGAVFHFHEVADVHFVGQIGIGAQAGEGADAGAAADAAVFEVREGLDNRVIADDGVFNHAVGADGHVVAELVVAFQHHVYINHHVLAVPKAAAQVEAGRVAQGEACLEQVVRLFALEDAFEFGELDFVVYAGSKEGGGYLNGMHGYAVGAGKGDDVGEVVFALGIVAGEAA